MSSENDPNVTWPAVGDQVRLRTEGQTFYGRGVVLQITDPLDPGLRRFIVLATADYFDPSLPPPRMSYDKGQRYTLPIQDVLGFEVAFRAPAGVPHPDSVPRIIAPNGALVETLHGWVSIEPGRRT